MAKIMSKKQRAAWLLQKEKEKIIKDVSHFATVSESEKRVSISHPTYDKIKKPQRDLIGLLVSQFGFYIQWEIFDIPHE